MNKRNLLATAALAAIGVAIGVTAHRAHADADGHNWRAYDTVMRSSPWGWLAYRYNAENAARAHKQQFPNHRIEIHRTGPGGSWINYIVVSSDFR